MIGLILASLIFLVSCILLFKTRKSAPSGGSGQLLTVPVDGKEYHRRNVISDDHVPVIGSLYDAFRKGIARNPDAPFLGYRQLHLPGSPYAWFSYKQIEDRMLNAGSALVGSGAEAKSLVGIYAKNSPDWGMIMHACSTYNLTLVPLYDTLGAKAMNHILDLCALEIVFVDAALVFNLLKWVKNSKVKLIIYLGKELSAECVEEASSMHIDVVSLEEFEIRGSGNRVEPRPPTPDDIALICFTSGTTGTPKGAMISHGNIAACCIGIKANFLDFEVNESDCIISYLPLAHVYQFAIECFMAYLGARIGYYQGNIVHLLDDFETLQPTIIPSVPRVLNKAYDRINSIACAKPVLGKIFQYAVSSKLEEVENGIVRRNSIWDLLLLKKVQSSFGGKCKLLITGSAPCRGEILKWYRAVLGCFVLEGFGQTELSGVGSMSLNSDHTVGHIGVPLPSLAVKLVDVPEKEYYAEDNKGELCFKGPTVFKGYYKDPEKTAEAIDSDGWLHSGDIGRFTETGNIAIIDRKKNMFKLAQGEYIAPDKIEGLSEQAAIVNQCFVYGESLKSSLVAIVVPDAHVLSKMSPPTTVEAFVSDPASAGLVLQAIQTAGQKELKSFEQVRHVTLTSEVFSVDNNLLTPTMKKRRHEIAKRYKTELQDMLENMQ